MVEYEYRQGKEVQSKYRLGVLEELEEELSDERTHIKVMSV